MKPRRMYRIQQRKAVRWKAEALLTATISKQFRSAWRQLVPSLRRLNKMEPLTKGDEPWWKDWLDAWTAAYEAALLKVVDLYGKLEVDWLDKHNLPSAYDPAAIINQSEIGGKISKIADDTRARTAEKINEWFTDESQTMEDLINALAPDFGERRARLIAINETTMLSSITTAGVMRSAGLHQWEWVTSRDDHVCPICGDLEGQIFTLNDDMPPDASHIGCRCDAAEVIPDVDTEYGDGQGGVFDFGPGYEGE